MSDHELYEIAKQRVNQRTRRWMLWGVNLLGLIFSLTMVILLGDSVYSNTAVALFMAWMGAFAFHSLLAWQAEHRTGDIENEVVKLRAAMDYEKPKRLEISDDGELMDVEEIEKEKVLHSR